MLRIFLLFFWMAAFGKSYAQNYGGALFDKDWKFHLDGAQGADKENFNDASWRNIQLPHDWSVEDIPGVSSPFSAAAISQVSGGFTTGGTGWYRKTFAVPAAAEGKKVFIQFDGVYMNSDVWINGHHLGNHPYGYTGFRYDLTTHLKYGGSNTIAVEVKNEGQNSRWYSGSGIYRHVWLQTCERVHIANAGTYITTPDVTASSAGIHFTSAILNESGNMASVKSAVSIVNQLGAQVATAEWNNNINAQASQTIEKDMVVKNPVRWSCDHPYLYKAVYRVYVNEKIVDEEETIFGIRTLSFSVDNGFQLNGKTLKLKGGCLHHDNGPLGARAYDRAEERRVELLKASGYNTLRCAHNPPSPAFLAACDRLGMLVIDEAFDMWNYGKNPYDYHLYFKSWSAKDIEAMVTRDRNHAAVIMWSIGNEVPERASPEGVATAKTLADSIRKYDPVRAITSAVNGLNEDKDPYFAVLDASGYNYAVGTDNLNKKIYENDHRRVPGRIMLGTESYPLYAFGSWMDVVDHPYVIGDFVWTAFDYIGEAGIGWLGYPQTADFYPWNLAYCGDIDICGWKRPQSYYRDALWRDDQLSVFVQPPVPSFKTNSEPASWSTWNWYDVWPDWTWPGFENKPLAVNVYSSCDEVELFLNNKSLGRKVTNRSTEFKAVWQVPYQSGTISATGYKNRRQVAMAALHTAGEPAQVSLTADRQTINADGHDLSYITVECLDQNGVINPKSNQLFTFNIDGDATIAAVGNADPMSTESYTRNQRKAWKGRCLVIVKAGEKPGNIVLTATAAGMPSKSVTIGER